MSITVKWWHAVVTIAILILLGLVLVEIGATVQERGELTPLQYTKNTPPGNIVTIHRYVYGRATRHSGILFVIRMLDDYYLVNSSGGLLKLPRETGKEIHLWSMPE